MGSRSAWWRRGWGAALGLVLACLLFLWMCAHYEIGRVESISGTSAEISVEALDRTFTAEVIDTDLEVGAMVVLNIAGDDATLVATSPGMVRIIVGVKKYLP